MGAVRTSAVRVRVRVGVRVTVSAAIASLYSAASIAWLTTRVSCCTCAFFFAASASRSLRSLALASRAARASRSGPVLTGTES